MGTVAAREDLLDSFARVDVTGERRQATFYTTRNCLMCDEAWAAVSAIAPFAGIAVDKVDVRNDAAASDRFAERVPVLVNRGRVVLEGPMSQRAVAGAMMRMWFGR